MQINRISTIPQSDRANFKANIPKNANVVSAFEYAQKLLETNRPSKLREVDSFCSSVRGILEYKPAEILNMNFGKTTYTHSVGKESEPLFVYYTCEAKLSDGTPPRFFGERATHPKHQKIAPAKLCFDVLKNVGKELLENLPVKRTSQEIKTELVELKTVILGC